MLKKHIRRDLRTSAFLYSSQASDIFNHRLHIVLKDFARDLADRIGDDLCAIVVGGSYGRGLGRCVRVKSEPGSGVWSIGEAPHDDIDIILVLERGNPISESSLNAVFRRYSEIMRTPIDLLAIVRRDRLDRVPITASWLELLWAHRVIYGPEDILDKIRLRIDDSPHGDESLAFHEKNGRDIVRSLRLLFGIDTAEDNSDRLDLKRLKSIRHLVDATLIAAAAYRPDPFARLDALKHVMDAEPWFGDKSELMAGLSLMYAQSNEAQGRDPQDFASWKEIIILWTTLSEFVEDKCRRKGYFAELRSVLSQVLSTRGSSSGKDWANLSGRFI